MIMERHYDLGYFGNIWVRQNNLLLKGDFNSSHKHAYDHVTLLAQGSVEVSVDGEAPKKFHAPTFIVIRKECKHQFKALTDDVVYYCVFALRNKDGSVMEDMYSEHNDPCELSAAGVDDDYWEKREKLDKSTTTLTGAPDVQ